MGLGSLTLSAWITEYRIYFIGLTLTLLAIAGVITLRERGKCGSGSRTMLYAAVVISLGLIIYAEFIK